MSFQDVYHNEVLLSRRTRSQRSHFWAKVVGVVLMVIIGATLRSEPQLRQALFTAGMDGVAAASGAVQAPSQVSQPAYQLPDTSQMQGMFAQTQNAQPGAPVQTKVVARPRDAVRVNRHGAGPALATKAQAAEQPFGVSQPDITDAQAASAAAQDLSKLLQSMKPGQ
jgi:hypothetical protein